MSTVTFEKGNIYTMKFIGDADLKPKFICVKRTPKTATFEGIESNEVLTKRIKKHQGEEYILAGSYSMAPSIKASNIAG